MSRTRLTNARLVDGTGAPPRLGELTIEDGLIAELGATLAADVVIDLEGAVLAPGFIDMHSHGDFALPTEPLAAPKVLQGITTEVVGNCGLGLCPANARVDAMYATFAPILFGDHAAHGSATLAEYRARLEGPGVSVNAACLIPHGNVRCAVMGLEERAPRRDELEAMTALIDAGMRDGAFGLSTGLVYPPGAFARTEELIELTRAAAAHGGLYASHVRDEGAGLLDSVAEAIQIGEAAGASVQLSHHKAAGRAAWGKVQDSLRMVDEANARGVSVHSDVYPYCSGSTVLAAMILPLWVLEGRPEEVLPRLVDPATRARIIREAKARIASMVTLPGPLGLIPKAWLLPFILRKLSELVVVSSVKRQHAYEGKNLREIAAERRQPLFDAMLDLLHEEELAVVAVAHVMREEDVQAVLRHARTMIGTDGFPLKDGKPHPRTYGSFPRVLTRYVRELGIYSLEEAVHRMTGLTAEKLGLPDRGTLAVGKAADLVAFDAEGLEDHATYEDPKRSPSGLRHVFVNGAHTVRDGVHLGARAGRVLRKA